MDEDDEEEKKEDKKEDEKKEDKKEEKKEEEKKEEKNSGDINEEENSYYIEQIRNGNENFLFKFTTKKYFVLPNGKKRRIKKKRKFKSDDIRKKVCKKSANCDKIELISQEADFLWQEEKENR